MKSNEKNYLSSIKKDSIIKVNIENAKEEIIKNTLIKIDIFKNYSEDFNEYRKYFKNHKNIFNTKELDNIKVNEWKYKENEFKQKKSEYNEEYQKVIKSLEEFLNFEEELRLLFYIQYAEMTANRVQNRLHEHSISTRIEEIEEINSKLKKQERNLKNIYIGFISFVSIFLAIFTLISGNINFFTNLGKVTTLKEITPLFLLINSTILISVITMLYFVYYSLKFFSKTENEEFPIFDFYIVPILLIGISLLLIC